jgi:glycosyltransferase involved in cell wall biosynthesis
MGKIKLLYIISISVRWHHIEWMYHGLDRERFDVSFILVCPNGQDTYIQQFVTEHEIPYTRIDCYIRPGSIFQAVRTIYRHCRRERVDIVHTHIFLASLVGLLGAFLARVPVRLNTRHHISIGDWMTPWLDKIANTLATRTIVASRLVEGILTEREKVPPHKLALIPFSIDLDCFRDVPDERVEKLRQKHNPRRRSPVIGVLARRTELKGIQYTIPAFQRLLEHYPDAYIVLAYAHGSYRDKIREDLSALPEESYLEIDFEDDVFALYQLLDLCVHVPTRHDAETFGLVYLEAMASGVPTVFTASGVGPDFFVHRQNTWVVEPKSSDQIYDGMMAILESEELRTTLVREGHRVVDEKFYLDKMVRAIEALYLESHAAANP